MVAQDEGGHIINTASFAGLVVNKGLGAYCVTKYGVVVSVLCPMIVRTNIRQSARNRPAESGGEDEQAPVWSKEEGETLVGGTIEMPEVAERVLRAIRNNELYIINNDASREFVRRRFDRIDKSFDG